MDIDNSLHDKPSECKKENMGSRKLIEKKNGEHKV